MKQRERVPDLYVLDALANDVEDIEAILRTLNGDSVLSWRRAWGAAFTRDEIVQALIRLLRDDQVSAYRLTADGKSLEPLDRHELPSGSFNDSWFGMTERGRIRHASWDPQLEDA